MGENRKRENRFRFANKKYLIQFSSDDMRRENNRIYILF